MGSKYAGLAHRVEDGATFSMAARLAAAHRRDPGGDASKASLGYRLAALTQLDWALAYAVLWRSDVGGPPAPWPQLIRRARSQGPVALTTLQRACWQLWLKAMERDGSNLWALGASDISNLALPPFVSACQGCGLMFYTSRRRRQTCATCQKRQERHKKRALRNTDLSERACPVCSITFTPRRSDARCCSAKCRAKLSRQQAAASTALPVATTPRQDQQIEAAINQVFTETPNNVRGIADLADNVRDVAEPGNNVPDLPSKGQDFKSTNSRLDPCNAEETDSPLTPSNAHTDEADTNSPHTPVLEPLKASCLDEACNLAHQLGWPKGIGSAIARQFGVSKQAVGQRKQKLVKG